MTAMTVRLSTLGPCVPCPQRATCRAPCAALESLLPAAVETPREEVSSPALMRGEGRDRAFFVLPPSLEEPDEPSGDAWARAAVELRRRVEELLAPQQLDLYAPRGPEALTRTQRETLRGLLAGLRQHEVAEARGVARQQAHKALRAAVRRLAGLVGDLAPKGEPSRRHGAAPGCTCG